jgi:hypothetical protein
MEIQNALNAGRTVTVHEAPITVSGWTGTGYIIDDPATGAGAYKISGGANGGVLIVLGVFLLISVLFSPYLITTAAMVAFFNSLPVLLTLAFEALGAILV